MIFNANIKKLRKRRDWKLYVWYWLEWVVFFCKKSLTLKYSLILCTSLIKMSNH